MRTFAERFASLASQRSPLCLGLDPSEEVFRHWGLPSDAEGLHRFCQTVLDAAADRVAVVKPQAGFFERFGPAGMAELAAVTVRLRGQGVLSLIDAKRGDVPGTMTGYAQAMLGPGGGFGGDAMTLSAYLGFQALRPAFERARTTGTAVFVVVHSSNPEGRSLQDARHEDGRTVAEALADNVAAADLAAPGAVGAVVGATIDWAQAALVERLKGALILAPGVGAQGADIDETGRKFAPARGRVLPSVSRDILMRGPQAGPLRDAIERYRDRAWAACGPA
ncbi:orotidine-5'-phosphate decarboxylase [Phenylobacterium sp.]|uniref:orotidine-5'-phosphate decarboxylase n=1 Tax=Phenylobacterium sp. TaxID=1871053 RepID=UPI00289ECFB5|nr:orotidine-5'-phosphate decarboxylase [Phenylobacterium sp.]